LDDRLRLLAAGPLWHPHPGRSSGCRRPHGDLQNKLSKIPCAKDLDLAKAVELTEGYNAADVSDGFIEKMKSLAIDRALSSGGEELITTADILKAAQEVKSTVSSEDVASLKRYEEGDYHQ
jgi:SpoVK/Ycf46/Vps4 family AAA+-type ATPase